MACIRDRIEEIKAMVVELTRWRVRKALDGRVIPAAGSDGWWTGEFTWHVPGEDADWEAHGCWTGERHTGEGLYTEIRCDGFAVEAHTFWRFANLGPYHKDDDEGTSEG